MAVAIGLGIGELVVLVVGAVAALFLASPPGQKAMKRTAEEITKTLSREEGTVDVAPPITDCNPPCPACPPCPAPPPPRTDVVPPSRPHHPCTGTHTHVYRYESNQNPKTCQCFCNLREDLICH